ncbi:ABC transporter ATP-binding protein [Nitrospirillum sp. BR 11828]|uniref:ABC transporter ATP-binding protein n=1 Tax=Nitrospirillum sp. BR 11828 TaxID=3104325 RepID=UPI002ACAAE94|nr:ATP-binding cassette domain-containing protein [Nitrospirillum sp. BR 11828]MDZ5649807.1 ATP-binding cassette domain-containing protein [Nitrospirillum sp. BR 11828]
MSPPSPLIHLRALRHRVAGRLVLDLPDWRVEEGEHGLLLGPSGSGKTTLLQIIAGLLSPTTGQVMVAGQDMTSLSEGVRDTVRGACVGLVFQQLHLVNALTLADNLRLAQRLAGYPLDDDRVAHLLARIGLDGRAEARPQQLSQGERQRLAIARAVVNRPALVLADEPTSALDDANCQRLLDLMLEQAAENGATLLIATHDARLKARLPARLTLAASVLEVVA